MQDIALLVAPDFKDDGIEPVTHPTDGQKLLRNVGSLIEPIRLGEQTPACPRILCRAWVRPETPALSRIEAKAHLI